MRASQDAMKYNCKDVLWLDAAEHKYVEEIGTSNAFFRIADEVITAPLDSGTILPGITRDSVIQLLKKWGIEGDYIGVGNCILGYKDEHPEMKKRKDNYVYYVR